MTFTHPDMQRDLLKEKETVQTSKITMDSCNKKQTMTSPQWNNFVVKSHTQYNVQTFPLIWWECDTFHNQT